jgi:methylase of polypeptide subunit release factors
VYNKATYDLIYDYHTKKGGQFEVAIDVATGTGQVAANLADKFKQVHGTDLSARVRKFQFQSLHQESPS